MVGRSVLYERWVSCRARGLLRGAANLLRSEHGFYSAAGFSGFQCSPWPLLPSICERISPPGQSVLCTLT
jgi:hypothetical protein